MSTALAIAFLLAMVIWKAVLHGRLVCRWNRVHPAIRSSYTLVARRAWHCRIGRLFVGIIISPAWG